MTYEPTDQEIQAELDALKIPDGDEDVEHPDTQFTDYNDPSDITDRNAQITWLENECNDLAEQDGTARGRVQLWEVAMRTGGDLPDWFDSDDRAFMVKQLS